MLLVAGNMLPKQHIAWCKPGLSASEAIKLILTMGRYTNPASFLYLFITASDVVRILDVLLTPDLSLEKRVTAVSSKCFSQLRQLCRIRRSLDDASVATLVLQ